MPERLVYVSRAAATLRTCDLRPLAERAAQRNRQDGLGGALLMLDGHLLQVIEGDRYRLQACYARITADPRHREVSLRQVIALAGRSFGGPGLALGEADEVDDALRRSFRYRPGFPVGDWDGDALVAFAQAVLARQGQAARQAA